MKDVKMEQIAELELFRSVVTNTPDQIYVVYASGEVIDVFLGNERLFKTGYDQMKGKNYRDFFSPPGFVKLPREPSEKPWKAENRNLSPIQ